jgi:hypothetical protein
MRRPWPGNGLLHHWMDGEVVTLGAVSTNPTEKVLYHYLKIQKLKFSRQQLVATAAVYHILNISSLIPS